LSFNRTHRTISTFASPSSSGLISFSCIGKRAKALPLTNEIVWC
jgi:hypothetical protein